MTYTLVLSKGRKRTRRKGLLPCPHCGGRAGLYPTYESSWCVQCDRCGATTMHAGEEEVVRRWNRRVVKDKLSSNP